MQTTFEIVHTCVPIQNTTAHEVTSVSHKYFTSVRHFFCHSYYPLSIPYLAIIFIFFANAYEALLQNIENLYSPVISVFSYL